MTMRPPQPVEDAGDDFDLFRHRLSNMIDLHHPLARLADLIDWARASTKCSGISTPKTRAVPACRRG
jgi:hypothetical protein